MILALIKNIEELEIYWNPIIIKGILWDIKKEFSLRLFSFMDYILNNR